MSEAIDRALTQCVSHEKNTVERGISRLCACAHAFSTWGLAGKTLIEDFVLNGRLAWSTSSSWP